MDRGGPMLERAHLYTVSKQQVSLIQVGDQCDDKEIDENPHIGKFYFQFKKNHQYKINLSIYNLSGF